MSMDKTIGSTVKHQQQLKIGYKKQMKTCLRSPSWGLVLLCAAFAFTVSVTVIVWTTDLVKIALNENMGIANNTAAYDIWSKPPIYPIVQVYLFNYTNADAFAKGIDKKLRVEEVGPYVYREYTEKVNIMFNDNGTVSYQGKSSFSFVPELSVGHQPRHERVIMPNIPLLSALSVMKDNFLLAQIAFLAVARGLETEQFVHVTAHDFMWGYDDPLFSAAATMGHAMPYKKFGILAPRVGLRKDTVTMYTGRRNVQNLGVVTRFNGQERLSHWSGECNRIDGTDGTMFPPNLLDRNTTIYIFQGDMCRRFPLQYTEDAVILGGIPVLRYRAPRNTFDNPDVNPENACFCHQDVETCLPSGLFNASPCTFGAPVVMSFPHFYLGDPTLREVVDGLNPDPEKHDGFIDIHKEMGVSLGGRSRIQFNMMVRKPSALNQLADFADGSVLPIAWFDTGVEELPQEIMSVVYHVTFTTRRVQTALQYVLLAVSCALLYVLVRRFRKARSPASNSDAGIVAPI